MKLKGFLHCLILTLTVGVATFTNATFNEEKDVIATEAAIITKGTKLYLKPNSLWKQANARFAAYFFNSNTDNTWVSMAAVSGQTDVYECTSPTSKDYKNVIFCRMNPGASANNWNNKWNQTGDLTYDGVKNLFTVPNNVWDGSTTGWSVGEYTATYYDGTTKKGSETIYKDNKLYLEFYEKEGYRLEGWYKEADFKTKFENGTTLNADTNLYAKYEEADDYKILINENFFGRNENENPYMNVYLFRSNFVGGENASFPGAKLDTSTKFGNHYVFTVDASKSFDHIILSVRSTSATGGDQYQTEDLELSTDAYSEYWVSETYSDKKAKGGHALTAYSLSYLLFDLGGKWEDNDISTTNCSSNYDKALSLYNNLSTGEKTNFQTRTDDVVGKARERFDKWCEANNASLPWISASSPSRLVSISNNENSFMIVAVVALGLITVFGIVISKKRKSISE